MAQTRICLVVFFSTAHLFCTVKAQYEKYSFKSFPANDLMPLESAYGHALEMYAAQDWKQSAEYLELSLRLHRLLKDSEAHCSQNCSAAGREHEENNTETTLLIMGHIIMRAACLKRCKTNFPVFSKSYPKRETLGAFEQRIPYRYLQYVYYQMNELERAVSAAHTYLERNPEDPLLSRSLNYYKSLFDTEEYLVDHEEKPCEALFLKAVKLYNSGDFSSSARDMELAAAEYFKTFNTCLMSCEGSYDVQEFKDFYPTLAGQHFLFQFQFLIYKSILKWPDNGHRFVNVLALLRFCFHTYCFNISVFVSIQEALRYFNQTTKLRELLEFAQNYLQTDDEDTVSSEEAASALSNPPDEEFEGIGDYEESFLAEWWQEPKTKGDTGEPAE
uniref:Prolyl 3-hydroxylase family member 4 (inactive) n=1 Tax=Sinocyclocheilus rhinocerous TaxID=307959 RepID=A0A673NGS4_9TELE